MQKKLTNSELVFDLPQEKLRGLEVHLRVSGAQIESEKEAPLKQDPQSNGRQLIVIMIILFFISMVLILLKMKRREHYDSL